MRYHVRPIQLQKSMHEKHSSGSMGSMYSKLAAAIKSDIPFLLAILFIERVVSTPWSKNISFQGLLLDPINRHVVDISPFDFFRHFVVNTPTWGENIFVLPASSLPILLYFDIRTRASIQLGLFKIIG